VFIPFLYFIFRFTVGLLPRNKADQVIPSATGADYKISLASVVLIDRTHGCVTKVADPPFVIRVLYRLAFQAASPYATNLAALIAAKYRREVAGSLTYHHFGREVVAPIIDITPVGDWFGLRSRFVIGESVQQNVASEAFLKEIAELFDSCGLAVWQVDPRSPGAYGNLILSPEGYKIIDLESGVPSPVAISGSWRRTARLGAFPLFDDADFERLRDYVEANKVSLTGSLGKEGVTKLMLGIASFESATRIWKNGEMRLWGRALAWLYGRFVPEKGRLDSRKAGCSAVIAGTDDSSKTGSVSH
jgi:hypothetical protein